VVDVSGRIFLHPKNIELNAFIRERLVAKGLAGCTNTLFKTAVRLMII
jgi:hypothetical protein